MRENDDDLASIALLFITPRFRHFVLLNLSFPAPIQPAIEIMKPARERFHEIAHPMRGRAFQVRDEFGRLMDETLFQRGADAVDPDRVTSGDEGAGLLVRAGFAGRPGGRKGGNEVANLAVQIQLGALGRLVVVFHTCRVAGLTQTLPHFFLLPVGWLCRDFVVS